MTTIDLDWEALLPQRAPAAAENNERNFGAVEMPSGGGESDGGGRALIELPGIGSPERAGDNLRRCAECGNLAANGRCLAAARREIVASRSYTPAPDWLRRCEGFKPLPGDPDQRPGRDRWPGLLPT